MLYDGDFCSIVYALAVLIDRFFQIRFGVCFLKMDVAAEVEVGQDGGVGVAVGPGRFEQFRRQRGKAAVFVAARGVESFVAAAAGGGPKEEETVAVGSLGDFQHYKRHFPGLKTPFQLPIECFPIYEEMLIADPAAVGQVNIMLRGAVAESTAAGYGTVVNRFHGFCMERGYAFPNFNKGAVLNFIQSCMAEGAGLHFFQKLLPALQLLEKILDVEVSQISPQVKVAVGGVKRELAKSRGIVKKATGYAYTVIQDLIRKEVSPFARVPEGIDAAAFRSLVRATVIYFTFCRFDDYKRLTDKDVTDEGSFIKIVFERSKNDQFGDNSISVIPVRANSGECPVALIRLYFRRFGLKFGGQGKLLNFRIRKVAGVYVAMPAHGLSRSNATKCTRQLLEKHGYDAANFTEKSMKVQGVTELLDSGEPLENVMVFGRWRTQTTPLHYRALSMSYRLEVARHIPAATAAADNSNDIEDAGVSGS